MIRMISLMVLAGTLAACGSGDGDSPGASTTEAAARITTGMKAPDATLIELDPCALFTADDVKPYLDGYRETEQEVSYGMTQCLHKGGSFTNVRLEIGGMSLEDFETKIAVNHNLMGDVELQEVPGVGDKAYFLRSLWVYSGDYILHIDVNSLAAKRDDSGTNKRNESMEIARKVVAKL